MQLHESCAPVLDSGEILDWLIIGGGLHGVHHAVALLGHAGVARERLRILDPQPALLQRWRHCTGNVGMEFLRSPSVHHLDVPAFSLVQFAQANAGRSEVRFAPPYNRPALALFDAHCRALIEWQRLDELHLRGAALARRQPGTVTLLSRHPPRQAQFDSDPGWLGPLNLTGFAKLDDPADRRRAIGEARHRGSAPRDVLAALRRAVRAGRVRLQQAELVRARFDRSLGPELWPRTGPAIHADRIVLATGFERCRPGPWLDAAIARERLPCAPCGFPLIDEALRWHPRIHVSGPLAELEIGPAARNIAGARMAVQAILRSLGVHLRPVARLVELA